MMEMQAETVEQVAKAVFEDFMDWQFGQPLQWEGAPPPNAAELDRQWRDSEWKEQREYHIRVAKAAIAALREDIARAIMECDKAATERAAKIADAHAECECDCGDVIAHAIRSQP